MRIELDVLAEKGVLGREVLKRLKGAWVNTADELYSRVVAAESSVSENITLMERELGLEAGGLPGFKNTILPYVSDEAKNAGLPKEYPLGARIPYTPFLR